MSEEEQKLIVKSFNADKDIIIRLIKNIKHIDNNFLEGVPVDVSANELVTYIVSYNSNLMNKSIPVEQKETIRELLMQMAVTLMRITFYLGRIQQMRDSNIDVPRINTSFISGGRRKTSKRPSKKASKKASKKHLKEHLKT